MKIKVDCKDGSSYIRISDQITTKNWGPGIKFLNENEEMILFVHHDMLKAVEVWETDYSVDKLGLEKQELITAGVSKKLNEIESAFIERFPKDARFAVKGAAGKKFTNCMNVFGDKIEVDQFTPSQEVWEPTRFYITAEEVIRETELELISAETIAGRVFKQLHDKIDDVQNKVLYGDCTTVIFGGVQSKSYLEADNWYWHYIARIELSVFGKEASF